MELTFIKEDQWTQLREIYLEAFPKRERRPYGSLRRCVKRKRAEVLTAAEGGRLLGFAVLIPYRDMVMVDYLAVSSGGRSKGTGSRLLEQVRRHCAGRRIALLIERLDDGADNREQRLSRRSFYVKNGFTSSGLFISGASGEMELMNYGGTVSREDYMSLQKYALGNLFFTLSNIRILDEAEP